MALANWCATSIQEADLYCCFILLNEVQFNLHTAGVQEAKDCICTMLNPDYRTRATAADILRHPWLSSPTTPVNPPSAKVLRHLRAFAEASRVRRLLLGMVTRSLVG